MTASGADGVVGFLGTDAADTEAIRQRVIGRLPPYMHPSEIHLIGQWPLNANGKIDRSAAGDVVGVGSGKTMNGSTI